MRYARFLVPGRFKEFQSGREDYRGQRGVHDTPRGRPAQRSEENIGKIKRLIEEDSRINIPDLVNESGLGRGAVERILRDDLGYTKKSARWVPRLLTDDHKRKHCQMAEDWLAKNNADPEFKKKVRKK